MDYRHNPQIIGIKSSFRKVFSQSFERTHGVHINFFYGLVLSVDYRYNLQIMV